MGRNTPPNPVKRRTYIPEDEQSAFLVFYCSQAHAAPLDFVEAGYDRRQEDRKILLGDQLLCIHEDQISVEPESRSLSS